jgi:DNA-binding PadR family transcriptional regulator
MTPAVFAHGHLRLYLLNLLDESSMHGYELIQALDERFGGTYKPSAGTIYPRLAKLEAEGLVTKTADGRKSTYAITAAGRSELEARRSELDAIETDVTDSVRRLADEVRASVNVAMKSLRADLASAAREARNDATRTVINSVKVVGLDSRAYLQEAEILLSEFRHQVRTDLRERVQHDKLTADTVKLLKQQLKDVREAVRASLRS